MTKIVRKNHGLINNTEHSEYSMLFPGRKLLGSIVLVSLTLMLPSCGSSTGVVTRTTGNLSVMAGLNLPSGTQCSSDTVSFTIRPINLSSSAGVTTVQNKRQNFGTLAA